SFLDEKMFLRGNHDIKLWLDTYYFQSDQSFSTSHDYKVAKIIANDLIQVYIEDQLYNKFQKDKSKAQKKLKWTGSKAYVLKRGFKNTDEEIRFFKYQKPAIVAKLIYYNAIYKIETKKPYGTKPIRKYLNK